VPRGDYLYLEFDPGGHGLEFDLEWTVAARDDRLVLLSEGAFCTPMPPDGLGMEACRAGDGALTIQVAPWVLDLRGHRYFIQFGNVRQERGVDHQVLRDILASFRAREVVLRRARPRFPGAWRPQRSGRSAGLAIEPTKEEGPGL
jgi:hypothetical protein